MKYCKSLFSMLVVLMLLVLSFTTASAQGESPQGQADVPDEPEFTLEDGSTEIPDLSTFTPLLGDYIPPEGLSVDATITALSPVGIIVYTRVPKFYFTKVAGAVKYKLSVYDWFNSGWVYQDYQGAVTCGDAYCWMQPSIKLRNYGYPSTTSGYYRWEVAAYTGTSWIVSANANFFNVLSSGFNSTFNGNAKKWIPLGGIWTVTDAGYYKTSGLENNGSTALHSEYFQGDYVYEIRLKRKVTNDPVRIYWSGSPEPLVLGTRWQNGYYLWFDNTGFLEWYETNDGSVSLIGSTTTPYFNDYGWNTFTIWHEGTTSRMYINGILFGSFSDTTYAGGWVGVQMTQNTTNNTPLLVDYAKVYLTSVGPLNMPYLDNSALDPAATWEANQIPADALDQ